LPFKLPDERGFTRKAPYQYGWDWGPRLVTSGIWKPVYIRAWDKVKLSDIQVVQNKINNDTAFLTANFEMESLLDQKCELEVRNGKIRLMETSVHLTKGLNIIPVDFIILNPSLWWPNGLGEQILYDLNFNIKASQFTDSINKKIGLRTIELVTEKDSIGESFLFRVNGLPVFMKGANYIPQDNFPSRVTPEKYENVIQSAVDANMNMLRVWGGGIYENDVFYDLCDQKGILVWQDFMFACNMYPGDSTFLETVKQEAIQNVKRLRNHPCLALWCGNNEVDEGWHNWGWQKALGYSFSDSSEVWNNYLKVFEELLPQTVKAYSPYTPYIPSSPRIGWGHEEAMAEGDMHYWGVWWGEQSFEVYEEKVGRFMSEYGFQGFPDSKTLEANLLPDEMNLHSSALQNHQKHPRGMELIQTYMEREYKVPENFEYYAYVSQLVQAYGIRKAIEAHRRAMPQCMGTLYWQLNDCWPVISWSSVDYYDRWKALHYFVQEAYKDILISFEENEDHLDVYIISDKQVSLPAVLKLMIMDYDGEVKWQSDKQIEISRTASNIYSKAEIKGFLKADHLLVAKVIVGDSVIAENLYYFLPAKSLNLPHVKISQKVTPTHRGYLIHLTADKLAKNVFLYSDLEGRFTENYFDLIPDESKAIEFTTLTNEPDFEKRLKIISLVNAY
jgi:beta-mannosidase